MSFVVLERNRNKLKTLLNKRRIMIYGAGEFAHDIYNLLRDNGLKVECFLVDDEYVDAGTNKKNGLVVTSIKKLDPKYDKNLDAILWAIAAPQKVRWGWNLTDWEYYIVWDYGFWKDKNYYDDKQKEYNKAKMMLSDELSQNVMDAYAKAQKGNICDDVRLSSEGTYFNDLTKLDLDGAFVDCGSYDGESAALYWKFKKNKCKVFAFEPDPDNQKKINSQFKAENDFNLIEKGCWSTTTTLSFSSNGDMTSAFSEDGDIQVDVTTIDEVVGNEKTAFIKMDIEGSELEALRGAEKVIKRDMPILAVSAYHRQEDFITLIPYINSIHSNGKRYKLYLRHHGCVSTELVLYGIPCED